MIHPMTIMSKGPVECTPSYTEKQTQVTKAFPLSLYVLNNNPIFFSFFLFTFHLLVMSFEGLYVLSIKGF